MARLQKHFQAYQVLPPCFFIFFFGPLPPPNGLGLDFDVRSLSAFHLAFLGHICTRTSLSFLGGRCNLCFTFLLTT
jgi:hypothetical protein